MPQRILYIVQAAFFAGAERALLLLLKGLDPSRYRPHVIVGTRGEMLRQLDADVRSVFSQIAIDEARHAALAHQLAPWFERRLGWRERNAVARARQDAIARVVATSCDFGLASDERELLGIPAPEQLRGAAMQLFATVC